MENKKRPQHLFPYSKLSLLMLLFFWAMRMNGQLPNSRSVYLELGGSAGIGSINYEKIFSQNKNKNWLWRAGISVFPIDDNAGTVFVFPIAIGGLIGKKNSQFEFGLGQGISMTTKGNFYSLITPELGYRYSATNNPLFFRIAYTSLISYILDFQYQQWAGISIGYQLNAKK